MYKQEKRAVVVGLQFGDEGKARVVDELAERAGMVVRYHGGANAGHTVEVGDQKYVFHLVPVGALNPTAVCVIAPGVVLDPRAFLHEIEELESRGISLADRLWVSDQAHVVMPWHQMLDGLKESAAGVNAVGTTNRGIGPCYTDKAARVGMRVADLLYPDRLREKVFRYGSAKNQEIELLYHGTPLNLEQVVSDYNDFGVKLRKYVEDTTVRVHQALRQNKRIIFEASQGTGIDHNHGTYRYNTSSSCVSGSTGADSGVGATTFTDVIGVLKAYTTRVGGGPFMSELFGAEAEVFRQLGNEYGASTGRPRRCGWLDVPMVRRAVMINGCTSLALTKVDILDHMDEIRVCTEYELSDGRRTPHYPSDHELLDNARPIYRTFPGWKTDTTKIRKWEDVPQQLRDYLNFLHMSLDASIDFLSVGPKRGQTLKFRGKLADW